MRELKARIRFTSACLGSVRKTVAGEAGKQTKFVMPRGADGHVRFEKNWWLSGLRFAAQLINRHQDQVSKVLVDSKVLSDTSVETIFPRRVPKGLVHHECFPAGMTVEIHFAVPSEITNEEFKQLLDKMGQFRGISPFGLRQYGHFAVDHLEPCEGGNAGEDP